MWFRTNIIWGFFQSNVAASNAKLSLFYDWLFFDPDKDSIMNIEPAILVMFHSIRPHPAITATLLDFMCRVRTFDITQPLHARGLATYTSSVSFGHPEGQNTVF